MLKMNISQMKWDLKKTNQFSEYLKRPSGRFFFYHLINSTLQIKKVALDINPKIIKLWTDQNQKESGIKLKAL